MKAIITQSCVYDDKAYQAGDSLTGKTAEALVKAGVAKAVEENKSKAK